ncbi:MAG: GWxTD domain-containing protein [Candidatus Cloacimonadota bacterium]|nr:GWxTD domain-containing protein [Candidatus Cloacimonadota bacterium]
MRKLFILLLISLTSALAAENLDVNIDDNRFFADKGTLLEINYEVPYNTLTFEQNEYGFMAKLEVELIITVEEKELHRQSFTNNIIVTNKVYTRTDDSFMDKISMTLSQSGYDIQLIFRNEEKQSMWNYTFNTLAPDAIVSDLELSSNIEADTTDFMKKFHRKEDEQNLIFMVQPSQIFDKNKTDKLYVYYQLNNLFLNENSKYDITETWQIIKDEEIIWEKTEDDIFENNLIVPRNKELSIEELPDGFYNLLLKIKDNTIGIEQSRKDFFSIKTKVNQYPRLFTEWEDDYRILRYFLQPSEYKRFQALSDAAKKNYVERFWNSQDPNPTTKENEFLELIRKRVNYVNRYYSHFKDGWETDVGRIYIKNGNPHTIDKGTTGVLTAYTTRDYQIWKYRGQLNRTYLFLDMKSTGSYKLIYCENDDDENTLPQWQSYMGEDFDTSELQ